ncbi:MAG: linear amide C-N hydrolase [Lachnospiraceae bacterium]|nr:linear amide C-N hydrolase [Lachnospiraceae bacterium]
MKNGMLPGACSCMTLTSKTGKHYWFRTCDIETYIWSEGAHIVQQAAGEKINYCDGKNEVGKYAYVGVTYNHIDSWLLDGVNECGLTGGLLMLNEGTSVDKPEKERQGYIGMELVTKILSSCKDVNEVIALAGKIQILSIPYGNQNVPATMHYFFTDSGGNEVILEATDKECPGILKIFPWEKILGVMTNSPPYEEQLQNLSWFLSQSPELKQGLDGQAITKLNLDGREIQADVNAKHLSLNGTFPASYCSYDRFIRLTILKALNDCGNYFEDEKMLALGSGIMNAVCEPHNKGVFHYTRMEADGNVIGQKDSISQYVVMYNIEETSIYLKKFDEVFWNKYML